MSVHPRDADLKRWAHDHGMVVWSVQKKPHGVLAVDHTAPDPFYVREPEMQWARWCKAQWERFGLRGHVRRLHYAVYTAGDVLTPETPQTSPHIYGTGKENAYDIDWGSLRKGAKAGRYRGLVDPEMLEDKRNAALDQYVWRRTVDPEPDVTASELEYGRPWKLPWGPPESLISGLVDMRDPEWELPDVEFEVHGYDYEPVDQPVHLVLVIEKSTMDDVVVPLCRGLHVDLLTGKGFESITRIIELCRLAERLDRHVHLLYVADYDINGRAMPFQMGRQIQFWTEELGVAHRLTIERLALTAEQIDDYAARGRPLPPNPDKPGQIELDALETIWPGELRRIIRDAVDRYGDHGLPDELNDAKDQVRDLVVPSWQTWTHGSKTELTRIQRDVELLNRDFRHRQDAIVAEARELLGPLEQRQAELADEYATEIERVDGQLDALWEKYRNEPDDGLDGLDLPDRPESEPVEIDDDAVVFDSWLDWVDQLDRWRRAANGDGS